jgi:hypothetical protein
MTELRRLERTVPTNQPTEPPSKVTQPPAPAKADTTASAGPAKPPAADSVAVTTNRQDRPAVDTSLFAVVVSPDREQTFADIRPDVLKPIATWKELPTVLKDLRERSRTTGQAVVLDLAVHGNNGTGLKVVANSAAGELASITSMAEVNRMVKEAGFAPGEIVILTEGCNVHRSWTASADGFTATEKQAAIHQAERLASGHGGKLAAAPEVVDHGPTKLDKSYLWLGRGPGMNWISTVFLQYVTGKEEGAPLQDLRQYKDPKAPLATQTDEVTLVAGMRGEMISNLQRTRFAVQPVVTSNGMRFIDRLSQRAGMKPAADDSGAPSPAPDTPIQSPLPGSPIQPHGQTAPQPERRLVPVQINRQQPAKGIAPVQPDVAPAQPDASSTPAQPEVAPAPAGPRFIDRMRALNLVR